MSIQTRELVDMATVGDLEIANDAVLFMVLKKDGSDSWEVKTTACEPPFLSRCGARQQTHDRLARV
jgi:hypothetical protein